MTIKNIRNGSLILYKGRLGRVVIAAKKLNLALADGSEISVRHKDVTLLHPGPVDTLNLPAPAGEIEVAWELLAGTETTLEALAALAYDVFTPASAWATWQYVEDGLLFSGVPTAISVHEEATVAAISGDRAEKAAADAAWTAFLARLKAGALLPQDAAIMNDDVVSLAGRWDGQSRVLRALGRSETPENAHALLLESGYADASFNPYPMRYEVLLHQPAAPLPPLVDEDRLDLTHLPAYAIDDEGNTDPDDAISLDGDRIWVHVADVAALVPPDSPADLAARARAANLYLPEGTVHMLPPAATPLLGLGLAPVSPALSIGFRLAADQTISDIVVAATRVAVTRLSYKAADEMLTEEPLRQLRALAQRFSAARVDGGAVEIDLPETKVEVKDGAIRIQPIFNRPSRAMVREAMLMAGAAVATFSQAEAIPMPYSTQTAPELAATTVSEMVAGGLAGNFAVRRYMKRGQKRVTPAAHAGLGLPAYIQATSPLRRYLDLIVHQQLRAHIAGRTLLTEAEILERIGAVEAVVGNVRRAERRSIKHWTLAYLQQRSGWTGRGVIVEKRGARDVVVVPELDLEAEVYRTGDLPLNSELELRLSEVNLPELVVHLRAD